MWRFVDLTDEEKHRRRLLLDRYGAVAQLSVLVPIIVLQLYFLACWLQKRWQGNQDMKSPSSPYLKANKAKVGLLSRARATFRRCRWSLSEPLDVFQVHISSRGEFIGAALWTGWLLLLCTLQTGDDYLHLTKRFGIVAASQLPFQYLLALKSPFSPLQALTQATWETLNSLHQLLGRITTFFFYLHAVFYLNLFLQKGILLSRLTHKVIVLGLVGIVAFTLVGTTALAWVRKRYYRLFYIVHVGLATTLLPVLYFHVSHIRVYIWQTLLVYLLHASLRFLATQTYDATLTLVPGTSNLLSLKIRLPPNSKHDRTSKWHPGQHVYLSLPRHPLTRTFHSNPFTIASLPSVDGHLTLIARVLDGNTKALAQQCTKSTSHPTRITLEGPYGLKNHPDRLLSYDRVLFLAGGVGATFVVPLYRALLRDLSPSAGSYRRGKCRFVWAVRELAETGWAVEMLGDGAERRGFVDRMEVCHSRGAEAGLGPVEDEDHGDRLDGLDGLEMEALLPASADGQVRIEGQKLRVSNGRMDVRAIVNETFAHSSTESVAVIVCGPAGMAKDVRKAVGRHVNGGRDVFFWMEAFGT